VLWQSQSLQIVEDFEVLSVLDIIFQLCQQIISVTFLHSFWSAEGKKLLAQIFAKRDVVAGVGVLIDVRVDHAVHVVGIEAVTAPEDGQLALLQFELRVIILRNEKAEVTH
jgi:hypothetical protein